MKNRLLSLSAAIFFTFIFSAASLFSFDGEQAGKIGDVNKKNGEITVESPKAAEKIQMGTKLYVRIDDRVVSMTATFPMQTVAKCKLVKADAAYLGKIKKGLPVYIYTAGVEKKDEVKKTEDPLTVRGGRVRGKTKIDEYYNIIGFSSKNTIDEVFEKLGRPTKIDDDSGRYNFDTAHWLAKDANKTDTIIISIGFFRETRKLMVIHFYSIYGDKPMGSSVNNFLASKKIYDKKTGVLGTDKAEMVKMIGEPDQTGPYTYRYDVNTNDKSCQVTLWHTKGQCYQLDVQWFK